MPITLELSPPSYQRAQVLATRSGRSISELFESLLDDQWNKLKADENDYQLSEEEEEAYKTMCNHGLNLNDFLDRMSPETSHPETDWGTAVGEEVLNDLYSTSR